MHTGTQCTITNNKRNGMRLWCPDPIVEVDPVYDPLVEALAKHYDEKQARRRANAEAADEPEPAGGRKSKQAYKLDTTTSCSSSGRSFPAG